MYREQVFGSRSMSETTLWGKVGRNVKWQRNEIWCVFSVGARVSPVGWTVTFQVKFNHKRTRHSHTVRPHAVPQRKSYRSQQQFLPSANWTALTVDSSERWSIIFKDWNKMCENKVMRKLFASKPGEVRVQFRRGFVTDTSSTRISEI